MDKAKLPVAVITVAYNPELPVLRSQLSRLINAEIVIVVDNGSKIELTDQYSSLLEDFENLRVIKLGANRGIASAQNIAAKEILLTGSITHLLFLDHDTVPDQGAVSRLYSCYMQFGETERLGALGPVLQDPRTQHEYGFHCFEGRMGIRRIYGSPGCGSLLLCDQLNSSGTMISVDAWREVGPFASEFFIDHVETEWCFRARSKAFKLAGCLDARMQHEMGDENCRYWLLGWKTMPYRSPNRHYYIFRNSLCLQKKRYVPLRWKFLNVIKLVFSLCYFSVVGPERRSHFFCMMRGLYDGVLGRDGPRTYPRS